MLFMQPRVISVHSYYLTSLVTSHFCRFWLDKFFSALQHSFALSVQNYCFDTLICEKPLCRKVFDGKDLSGLAPCGFVAFFDSQQVFMKWLIFFVSSDFFQDLRSSESKDPKLTVIWKPCSFGFDFEDLGSVEMFSLMTSEIKIYFAACDLLWSL